MKLRLTSLAVLAAFATGAQAAPTVISDGLISATIADNGVFSSSTGLGLSYNGNEFVNHGTWASWAALNANGNTYWQSQNSGLNDLNLTATGIGTSISLVSGTADFTVVQTITAVGSINTLGVSVKIFNTSGKDQSRVFWNFGFDPDQGIPQGLGFGTQNDITSDGTGTKVSAASGKYAVTLMNDTTAGAFQYKAYVDPFSCCSDVDGITAYTNGQAAGYSSFGDQSINLAYDIGTLKAGGVATLGYNLVFAPVPEPETYAMFLAGLGLMGVVARRRTRA